MSQDKVGGRLARQMGLGPPGMARRYGLSGGEGRAESPVSPLSGSEASRDRLAKAEEAVKQAEAKPTGKRGRPKSEGDKPWEAEGLSRSAWYRKQKEAP